MIPRNKQGGAAAQMDVGAARNPAADYSKFNEDPQTFKTDRENSPYSPALMEKMETAHRDKDGWTIKPRRKPTRKP